VIFYRHFCDYGGLYENGCYWFYPSKAQPLRPNIWFITPSTCQTANLRDSWKQFLPGVPGNSLSWNIGPRLDLSRESYQRTLIKYLWCARYDFKSRSRTTMHVPMKLLECFIGDSLTVRRAILQRWKRAGFPPVFRRTNALFQARCTRMHSAPLTRERNQRVSSSHCPYRRLSPPLHALSRNTEIADVPFRRRRRERNP